jgi:hypothetical protein
MQLLYEMLNYLAQFRFLAAAEAAVLFFKFQFFLFERA